jgi:general secretion pathway protein G
MLIKINELLGRTRVRARVTAARRAARNGQAGFTLLEIMIVLAIIAMIAGGVGVALFNKFKKAQIQTTKMRVKAVREAVTQYMIETPSCPKGMDEMLSGKYIDKDKMKDAWGSNISLKCPGTNDTEGADVSSPGPDKQDGTADDIKSWEL